MTESKNVKELIKKISTGKIPQNAIIYGEETFFIDKILEQLEIIANKKSLELRKYTSSEIKLRDLLDLLQQGTLFNTGRIFVVTDFVKFIKSVVASDDLIEDARESERNELIKRLIEYLKNPNPDNYLFLIQPERIDMRLKFFREISKVVPFFNSKRVYDRDVFEFVEQKFNERKIKVEYKVIEYIIKTVGNNLYDLDAELNRLFISLEHVESADIDSIKKFIIPMKKYSVFDLLNAFRDKNIPLALEIGINLIENNSPLVYIIAILQRYFFSLLIYDELRNTYKSDEKIATIIGCHPFFLKDYEIASKRYRFEELEKIFDILLKKDIELKSLNPGEEVLYSTMISEIGLAIKKL